MYARAQNLPKSAVGGLAYNIVGVNQNGTLVDMSDYRGTYILLNFTATNCGPCWKTYPIMNQVQEEYADNLKVISFHLDNDTDKWQTLAKKKNINFKCTAIWESSLKQEILDSYKVDGFPYFFLIDKNGVIVKKWFGNQKSKLLKVLNKYVI